jgi:CheY-like chemotaxis protein
MILLERILLNLLGNAIRYTPKGGRVLLACRRRGQCLRVEVRDNGIGIPLDKQQEIFREFVQLGNAERSRSKGLGLGLSIVQRLCRLLRCPLDVRSAPGKGSVFAVEIPLAETQTVPDTTASGEYAPVGMEMEATRQAQVLVVEDDPLVLAGTRRLLSSWGHEVQVAASLQQAQQLFPGIDIDLLICDYRLPDGSGLDVIRRAEQFYRRKLSSILVSGDTAPEVLKEIKAQGWHLLHKPVRPAKLHSLVSFALKSQEQ